MPTQKAKQGFTPGPWTLKGFQVLDRNGDKIATVEFQDHRMKFERSYSEMVEADARLIAQCPTMLEVLKMLCNIATHPQATKAEIRKIAAEARAVIALAEGRAGKETI